MEKLFVYGTLKRGGRNHYYLADSKFIDEYTLTGVALINSPSYPFAFKSEGAFAVGEIYEVSEETLSKIDILEECDPNRPDALYMRKSTFVSGLGKVWLYMVSEKTAEPLVKKHGTTTNWRSLYEI